MLREQRAAALDTWEYIQERAVPIIVFIYLLTALLAFALIPLLAGGWLRLPFIGAFVEHTLMVNTVAPARPGSWELQRQGLPFGYQLDAVDGETLRDPRHLGQILAGSQVGQTVTLSLSQPGDPQAPAIQRQVTLQPFPSADRFAYLVLPYLTGLVYLASGIWVFSLRRWDAAGRAFAIFATSVALGVACLFDVYTTHLLTPLWTLAVAMAGGALFNLAVLFPEELRLAARYPALRWLGYLPALALAFIAAPTIYNFARPIAYVAAWRSEFIFTAFSALLFLAWTAQRRYRSPSPIVREQARLILIGALFAFGPLAVWLIVTVINPGLRFSAWLLPFLAVFPAVTGYAVLRYRLLNIDYVLSRATLYALLTVMAASAYALLVSGASLLLGSALPPTHPLIIGLMVFLIAVAFNPVRTRLQGMVDQRFFRGQAVYRERLDSFSRQLTAVQELPAILAVLRSYVEEGLYPSVTHIFIHDSLSDQYAAAPALEAPGPGSAADPAAAVPTTDLRFPAASSLVQVLARRRGSIFLGGSDSLPSLLQNERSRLALLGVQLFIPLPGQQQLIGWLALGPRRSGEPYTTRDLGFLETLSAQAALAIERAQVVANLERRVREMDVLARVSQGINITPAFDDILELIYAQTSYLLPCLDFHVTLSRRGLGHLYHAFYLENDERLVSRENKPIEPGMLLESEVIRSQRSLVTDDYQRECRSRGIPPAVEGIFAWMGVPLNAGAETIGAISLASRDQSVVYTEQQCSLLQSIADQAAGAIVKARLLQESERRARQLATLNEIARGLTSTLEVRPLLDQILNSAVEILSCEAGSLFMVDETNGELIFEVTAGPVAGDLVGHRLPPGTGLVGQAADSGQAVISNDVHRTQGWSAQPDEKTGFVTRDLLAVPMVVKERVIGVVEVINKTDGTPFTSDDQDLLATFTSQAAIAIENARLYSQTDAALAARVEELSVMQRIDRELNASLDVERTLRIALDWAVRQSRLSAGFVGLVQPGEDQTPAALRLVAWQGYTSELDRLPADGSARLMSLALPLLQSAIESGQPVAAPLPPPASDPTAQPSGSAQPAASLLPGALIQVAVPIRRQSAVIGAFLLESAQPDAWKPETLAFLSRLSDHAAIALSNAQLYAEVQAANIAKSDFVSLVSHELKTPMTSIRGYSDLLSKGAVGPVNEMQANFLSTIRSNVNRMATLVSDLADVSRIEAGRMRLEFSALAISDALEEVVRSVQAQVDEKKQSLSIELEPELPRVWGDSNRLIQILANLVSNANKYTPEGGSIRVAAERSPNRWDPQGAPEVVHIIVSDTGYGISPDDQKRIFQKFFRSDDQNVRNSPGTGLGLNITRHLVEMQGGRIWFESQTGKGASFHFTIPVSAAG